MTERFREIRRATLLVLYAADVAGVSAEEALDNAPEAMSQLFGVEVDDGEIESFWDEITKRVNGVLDQQEEIDDEIRELSPNWRVERMAAVDRNLLRLGIFEILEEVAAPLIVINACVELAKEFGTATTPGFINGLLDQLCQNHDIPIEASPSDSR